MEITTGSVRRVAERCRQFMGDEAGTPPAIGYPASLALCLIDAIYATGSHPTAVSNIIDRYVVRHGCGDGAKSLRYSIASAGGSRAWAETVAHNRKPANTHPGALLKAEIVDRATRLMADLDIETVPDLLSAVGPDPSDNEVIAGWRTLPSQHSAVTYFHLLSLAGSGHFEADRAVRRFLAEASVEPDVIAAEEVADAEVLTADDARSLVPSAAEVLGAAVDDLGRLVWQAAHRRILPARHRPATAEGANAVGRAEAQGGGSPTLSGLLTGVSG